MKLVKDQQTARVTFRLSTPYIGTGTLVLLGSVLPDGPAVPITKDPSGGQLYHYTWTGRAPTDTVRVLVQTDGIGAPLSDTLYLIPPVAPSREVTVPNYAAFVWLRERWIPTTVSPEIQAAGAQPLTPEACERIRFDFAPQGGGTVQPDSGFGRWVRFRSGRDGCVAQTRWKLGDATGEQQLRLRVGGSDGIAREEATLRANARELPRIVAGYAHFSRHEDNKGLFCATPTTPEAECKETRFGADSVRREFTQREPGESAFFGVEFPLFIRAQPSSRVGAYLSRRVRLVLGSTFTRPEDNAFLGVSLIPLAVPAYEGVPFQLQAGWRFDGGYMAGGSIDGSALISNVLKALGAPL